MGGDREEEYFDRLLDHDHAADPFPSDEPLARLLYAAATPDVTRASAGEEAAVAAFRAAQHGAMPSSADATTRKHPTRRLLIVGAITAGLAAFLLTVIAFPHFTGRIHAHMPALKSLTNPPPGITRPRTDGPRPRPSSGR